MNTKITVFLAVLILALTSCGDSAKNETLTEKNRVGKTVISLEKTRYYYFLNDKEVLQGSLERSDSRFFYANYKYTYTFTDNKLTINNRNIEKEDSKNSVFLLQDNKLIQFYITDGTWSKPKWKTDGSEGFNNIYYLGDFKDLVLTNR